VTTGAPSDGATAVLVVVPNGTIRPEPLADAVLARHREWNVSAVWTGDPQLQPVLGAAIGWHDARVDELDLVGDDVHAGEWRRAIAAASTCFSEGARRVLLLWAGSVAVLDSLDGLLGAAARCRRAAADRRAARARAAARRRCSPGERDLVAAGPFSTTVAVVSRRTDASHAEVLRWLDAALLRDPDVGVGPWLARAAEAFGRRSAGTSGSAPVRGDGRHPASRCSTSRRSTPRSRGCSTPRWSVPPGSTSSGTTTANGCSPLPAPSSTGGREPLRLPGGIVVDATVRRLVRDAARAGTGSPPRPWTDAAAFRRWLEERYWPALHAGRPDLRSAFPEPVVRDAAAFRDWTRSAFAHDAVPYLLTGDRTSADAPRRRALLALRRAQPRRVPHPRVEPRRRRPSPARGAAERVGARVDDRRTSARAARRCREHRRRTSASRTRRRSRSSPPTSSRCSTAITPSCSRPRDG
jgi:hypothetical protein